MLTTIQESVTVGHNGLIQLHVPGFEYNSRLSVVAVVEAEKTTRLKGRSLAGALKDYANSSLIKNEKDIAWAQVARDKQ